MPLLQRTDSSGFMQVATIPEMNIKGYYNLGLNGLRDERVWEFFRSASCFEMMFRHARISENKMIFCIMLK